jgi:hypothetical protein
MSERELSSLLFFLGLPLPLYVDEADSLRDAGLEQLESILSTSDWMSYSFY